MGKVKQIKVYPLEKFVGKNNVAKTPFCLVRISPTKEVMLKDIKGYSSKEVEITEDLSGYYIGYDLPKSGPRCCAIVFMSEDSLLQTTLIHEAVHVSIGLLKNFGLSLEKLREQVDENVETMEELLATSIETIVEKVFAKK